MGSFERHIEARRGAFTLAWSWPAAFLGPIWYLRYGMWDLGFVYSGMIMIASTQFGLLAIPTSFVLLGVLFKSDRFRYRSFSRERVLVGSLPDLMHPNVSLAELRMALKRGWLDEAEYDRLASAYDERESIRAASVLRADAFGQELSHTKNLRLRREYRERFGLRDEAAAVEWGDVPSGAVETKS